MTRLRTLINEVLSTPPKKKDCGCGCNTCEGKSPVLTEGKVKKIISEDFQYHVDNKIPLHESVYRIGSKKHLALINEARILWTRGLIDVSKDDQAILETHLGHFGLYEGVEVPLDLPMVNEEAKMPSQEEVDKFFSITQNEMHYLNSKPVMGQEGDRVRSEIEPWDEYDLSNWNALVRKAKAQGKINENNLLKQAKLSSEEYQKAKKLKGFNADDYTFSSDNNLYVKEKKSKFKKHGEMSGFDMRGINEGKIDRVVGGRPYDYVGDGRKGQAIVSGPMKDREKEAIIKRAKEAGYIAKPNMGGGVTIQVESLNEEMGEWPKELTSRYSDEYRFELEKVTPTYQDKPGRAKYRVIDIESGELKGTPVFGTPESLMDFADDLIKPQGGTQSTNLGESLDEAMVDYDFSKEELIRVIKQLKSGASGEIGMIKAFEKALGRELTDDEIRGFKIDPSKVGRASLEERINTILEAKKKKKKEKKDPPLNKPKRGGSKAYYVYVRDPKTKKIKKVSFGSGGLRAKIKNKEARNAFAARHNCKNKKDRTMAGYWSCNLPRYADQLGLGSKMNTFW